VYIACEVPSSKLLSVEQIFSNVQFLNFMKTCYASLAIECMCCVSYNWLLSCIAACCNNECVSLPLVVVSQEESLLPFSMWTVQSVPCSKWTSCLFMLVHHQHADQNVLWALTVLRKKHVSTRNVWTHVQPYVVLMPAVKLWTTAVYVPVLWVLLVILLFDALKMKVSIACHLPLTL